MDIITIIGFISSLVTIEEGSRSWVLCILNIVNKKNAKKKLKFAEWNTDDESTQRVIDAFKCNVAAEYREHIFHKDEIEKISEAFLEEKSDWHLGYFQKKEVRRFISRTLEKYNEYNRSQMSPGERIIEDSVENVGNKLEKKVGQLYERLDDLEQITNITKENTDALVNKDAEKNRNSFFKAVHISKSIKLELIDNTINGEYLIDRSSIINRIKKEARRFISVQGNAGSGKSALCKMLIMDEEYVLIARAEELVRANNLKNVWDCELDKILDELSERRIVIYIDALEFIADYSSEKFLILQELYDIANGHDNVFIISSCRTSDRNAFIKLHTKYDVATYEVDDITESELNEISESYPVIRELRKQSAYSELLKNPFYINLVVSKGISTDDISDENELRDYIWKNIICLNEKAVHYGIDSSDVYNTINTIVFERAKKFLLGIREWDIQTSVLKALISEGVVAVTDGLVRLKYDIFEDICFEQYFDKVFEESRGNLNNFYETIISLGSCVYRRYQIWIANKLFVRTNRSKFIYQLLFVENADEKWKKQTEIGIVKSKYCKAFFEEYLTELEKNDLIDEFLDVINLYAFEVRLINNNIGHDLKLLPVGKARECMIQLIFDKKLYIDNKVNHTALVKMCSDYANHSLVVQNIASCACRMVEYYLDIEISNQSAGWYYSSEERLGKLLTIEYLLAEAAKPWLNNFFEIVKQRYLSDNREECRWANDIAIWTFENAYFPLTKHCGDSLCDLANCVFFEAGKNQNSYFSDPIEEEKDYGLSDNASKMHMSRHETFKYFLINLFKSNLKMGLEWAVSFTNQAFGNLSKKLPESVINISIYFPDTKEQKTYYANSDMWICRAEEYRVPIIISDIIYYAKEGLIWNLDYFKQDHELFLRIGEWIKKEIYSKSNNVATLSIIQEIGFHFQKELPGYALELASSYELIHWDSERYLLYHPSSVQKLLEHQIMMVMGVPELEDRYVLDKLCDYNLQEYVSKIQLVEEDSIREKAMNIIDYLYELVDNGTYDDDCRFQAQKMDLRNPSIKDLGNGYYEISSSVPKKAVNPAVEEEQNKKIDLNNKIKACIKQANEGLEKIEYAQIDRVLDELFEYIKINDLNRIQYENYMVQMIVISLTNKSIVTERRDTLCKTWALGVKRLFENGSFVANIDLVPILLKQLDEELSQETTGLIKSIVLESIINQSNNGQINRIADFSRMYLETNNHLAKNVFATILKLAEDEMNHQKYNADYLKSRSGAEEFEYFPNMKNHLRGVDYHFHESDDEQVYESKKEEIIQNYLMDELPADFSEFDLDNYDIQILCAVSNSGLSLFDEQLYMVVKQIVLGMIDIAAQSDSDYNIFHILGTSAEHDVIRLFQRELGKNIENFEKALTLLFDDIDFGRFKRDILEFYLEIFSMFISCFFDAYQEKEQRTVLEEKIESLEKRINAIDNSYIRIELTQAVALIDTKFYTDWNECLTSYTEKDKRFLNQQYGKYGHYHLKNFICTLYQMHIKELLPDILESVEKVFTNSIEHDTQSFAGIISKQQWIVNKLLLDAYLYNSDEIKADEALSNAYIHILKIMIELNNEKAAVLLDEFLIH